MSISKILEGLNKIKEKKEKMPDTYKGEPTKLGGGGRFKMMVDKLMAQGYDEEAASAIAASIGRKKLGKKKFQKLAANGVKGK